MPLGPNTAEEKSSAVFLFVKPLYLKRQITYFEIFVSRISFNFIEDRSVHPGRVLACVSLPFLFGYIIFLSLNHFVKFLKE